MGIFVFVLTELMRVDVPKSPVKRGRIGWLMLRFAEAMPRNPAMMNIIIAFVLESFSVVTRKIEIQIRKNAIICFTKG